MQKYRFFRICTLGKPGFGGTRATLLLWVLPLTENSFRNLIIIVEVFGAGWVSIGVTIHADAEVVLLALVMTTLCCTATIIFAIKTKFDMTQYDFIL